MERSGNVHPMRGAQFKVFLKGNTLNTVERDFLDAAAQYISLISNPRCVHPRRSNVETFCHCLGGLLGGGDLLECVEKSMF